MKCPSCSSTEVIEKHVPDEKIGPITIRSSCSNCKSEGNVTHLCTKCSSYLCSKCAEASTCFVATAAFGTDSHPDVVVLRHFRDDFLMTRHWGRRLVSMYVNLSPPIADFISRNRTFRGMARHLIVIPAARLIRTTLQGKEKE